MSQFKGGGCIFENCIGATCDGGGCKFINPSEVLLDGYCNGHNCFIDDQPHPELSDYLTV
jgi:hypothetical protein